MFVRTLQVGQQSRLRPGGIGVFMKRTAQRRGQLGIDAVAVEKNPVVTRSGRFARMAVGRTVVSGKRRARDGQQRNMAEVPMPLVGVGKAVNHAILILVARPAVEFGDGADLHHGVRERRAGEDLGSPRTFGGLEAQIDAIPERRGSQQGIHIVGKGFLRRRAPGGQGEQYDTKSGFQHKR